MRWLRWTIRTLIWTAVAVLIVAAGAVVFLTRTGRGVDAVAAWGIQQLERRIQGTVTVEGVSTPDLLSGLTLRGLTIRERDGREVVRMDSLHVRYSVLAFLRGAVVLDQVEMWRPRVTVVRRPGETEANVFRVLSGGDPGGVDTTRVQPREGTDREIVVRNARMSGGEIHVLLPPGEGDGLPEGAFTGMSSGDEYRLRRYSFREIDAELPRTVISSPDVEGIDVRIGRLGLVAELIREPVTVEELQGRVRVVGSSVVLDAASLRLPGSRMSGRVRVGWGTDGLRMDGDIRADPLELADLRWLRPGLPDGRIRAALEVEVSPDGAEWRMDRAEYTMGESTVRASGTLRTAPVLAFAGLEVEADPLALSSLEPWLSEGDSVPLEGVVRGRLALDGDAEDVQVDGRLTLEEPGYEPTTATVSGSVRPRSPRSVNEMVVSVDPLDYGILQRFSRRLEFDGTGSVRVEASGSLEDGTRLDLVAIHRAPGLPRSRLQAAGTVRRDSADVHLDLTGELDRLALGALRGIAPDLGLSGELEGPVRVRGRLGDLQVETDLTTAEGRLAMSVNLDVRDPASGYRLEGEVDDFHLARLSSMLPDPTTVTGRFSARGRGLERATVVGDGEVRLRDSRIGRLAVDSATLRIRSAGGDLHVDTLAMATNAASVDGRGRLALQSGRPDGEIGIAVSSDSLATARSFLFGDSLEAEILPLQREALELGGEDPDTLSRASPVVLSGRLRGEATLRGSVDRFDAAGTLRMEQVRYGEDFVEGMALTFDVRDVPDPEGRMTGTLTSDSVVLRGSSFQGGRAELEWSRPEGSASVDLRRSPSEDYRARLTFDVDSVGGSVHLEEMALRFDEVVWNLDRPATIGWGDEGITIRDFRMVRPGADGMRIGAEGTLPSRGEANFQLDVRNLSLERLARLSQGSVAMGGRMDLELNVTGTAARPVIAGVVGVDSLRFRGEGLSRVDGEVDYRDRRIRGSFQASRDGLEVARIDGDFPADLAFGEVEARIPDEPMGLRVSVDSFPLAYLTTVVEDLEEVRGSVGGEFRVGGTPGAVEPSGSFHLSGGSALVSGLGIRFDAIAGDIALSPEGVAEVDLEARSGGVARVRGTVDLDPVSDPAFDLRITPSQFRAVNRRDIAARVGGEVTLRGRYRAPEVTGSIRVVQGTLYLEEFARSAEVIDLADPAFFEVVDTTLVATTDPFVGAGGNPFLENLNVDVDVRVERDTWLRSRDMNVEMRGELLVTYNRSREVLVLVGELQATRGSYSAFGRPFEVRRGTVEFVGTPGIDPSLNIEAVTRFRTGAGEPLTIIATLVGTLSSPRLSLTSDAQPAIAESNLVSYLFFGRPSYALGSGESAVLRGAAGSLLGAAGEAGVTLGLGTLASQLGSVARNVGGVDYLSITQDPGSVTGSGQGVRGTVASTLVEAGWYLRPDLFAALVLRPLSDLVSTSRSRLSGVRVEWQVADSWTVEGFAEDRFSREQVTGFGQLGFQLSKVFGFFIHRDWGY